MGANQSTKSLQEYTKEEIGSTVASYGAKFQEYQAVIIANGMDGGFLTSIETEQDFLETLDDLEIHQRLHRKKLLREWSKATGNAMPRNSLRHSVSIDSAASPAQSQAREMMGAIDAENVALRRSLEALHVDQKRHSSLEKRKAPPKDQAVIVLTDIEESTSLWETNPIVMRQALNLHDKIMRSQIAVHAGYEITTEGDAFSVAFHDATDALNFALRLQEAMNAVAWAPELLRLPWAADDGKGRRGLRVRVSMHLGSVKQMKDPCSDRISYSGDAVDTAKSLESLAVGGQIIASLQTWEAANEAEVGAPLVSLLGTHLVAQKRDCTAEPTSVNILEVAPPSLNIIGKTKEQTKTTAPVATSTSSTSTDWLRGMIRGVATTTRVS
ncbi:Putative serine/threonine-protein kinase/receptor [Seminavis robusta]|uniref:Serine/threonine-protein kinase/receptor n=1 Tax=Seminavis robusta TaxID=568900 RepID=A0A9N8DXK2_9STRA|nr:Putative serine/threonine-protein kinase/receptor [Seminavis robusta]|eukprot:Sro452_g145960.1 Putative serine/threonine-protein kinase/receptor (384) ;mRNA; f:53206-54357